MAVTYVMASSARVSLSTGSLDAGENAAAGESGGSGPTASLGTRVLHPTPLATQMPAAAAAAAAADDSECLVIYHVRPGSRLPASMSLPCVSPPAVASALSVGSPTGGSGVQTSRVSGTKRTAAPLPLASDKEARKRCWDHSLKMAALKILEVYRRCKRRPAMSTADKLAVDTAVSDLNREYGLSTTSLSATFAKSDVEAVASLLASSSVLKLAHGERFADLVTADVVAHQIAEVNTAYKTFLAARSRTGGPSPSPDPPTEKQIKVWEALTKARAALVEHPYVAARVVAGLSSVPASASCVSVGGAAAAATSASARDADWGDGHGTSASAAPMSKRPHREAPGLLHEASAPSAAAQVGARGLRAELAVALKSVDERAGYLEKKLEENDALAKRLLDVLDRLAPPPPTARPSQPHP